MGPRTLAGAVLAVAGLLLTACSSAAKPPPSTPAPEPSAASPSLFIYEPLFPFASPAQARAWQASYAAGGHQPWHLSAEQTALRFTADYLGFREIDQVAGRVIGDRDARVTVGFARPSGGIGRAAVIHLVRYGTAQNPPWEVVGTDDTEFTLDVPAYGASVSSAVRVAGTITGVDENIGAELRTLGAADLPDRYCCLAAGGQASRWSLTVPFHATSGQVITIVVHTGGHVAAVERFAVTGVRVR